MPSSHSSSPLGIITTMSYATTTTTVTTVECQKQVRSWRLLRYLIQFLIPSCFIEDQKQQQKLNLNLNKNNYYNPQNNNITGTIFGYRKGKVRLCIQSNTKKSTNPLLLLEFTVPTTVLAREMEGGVLRIALECCNNGGININSSSSSSSSESSLMLTPVWSMYCNGRKVGYALKRSVSKGDMNVLKRIDNVVVGAGIISGKELDDDQDLKDDEVMYLRANFRRVSGSSDSESYHLIDPDGNIGQELSIFFFRSRR